MGRPDAGRSRVDRPAARCSSWPPPRGRDGHVNLSPKGYDTFRVLGPRPVAYLDLTGSGVETIAHLRQNGRITIMFCAFEGRPASCASTAGRGAAARRPGFEELAAGFPSCRAPAVIVVTSSGSPTRAATPCRWTYVGGATGWRLGRAKGDDGLAEYRPRERRRASTACRPRRLARDGGPADVRRAAGRARCLLAEPASTSSCSRSARPAVADRVRGDAARAPHDARRPPRRRRHPRGPPARGPRVVERATTCSPPSVGRDRRPGGDRGRAHRRRRHRRHRRPHVGPVPGRPAAAAPGHPASAGPRRSSARSARSRTPPRSPRWAAAEAADRVAAQLQAGEIPSSGAPRPRCPPTSAGGSSPRATTASTSPSSPPARTQPARTTSPATGSSSAARSCCATSAARCSRPRARLLLGHHPVCAPASPAEWPRSYAVLHEAQAAAVTRGDRRHPLRGGRRRRPRRHRRRRLRDRSCTAPATASASRSTRTRTSCGNAPPLPRATPSRSSPASTSRAGSGCGSRTSWSPPGRARPKRIDDDLIAVEALALGPRGVTSGTPSRRRNGRTKSKNRQEQDRDRRLEASSQVVIEKACRRAPPLQHRGPVRREEEGEREEDRACRPGGPPAVSARSSRRRPAERQVHPTRTRP